MCGIAGSVDFHGPVDGALLHAMCSVMEHRGPDGRGVHVEDGAGLGMQRLAIIDVEGGDQPIFNEDKTVAVVLNGEIYNFRELREELRARGHHFSTDSDTEVIVHLYEDHGHDLVQHLRGMFAFAVWDRRRRRMLLARDRIGKKPLFYAHQGARVTFASEMRALLQDARIPRAIDPEAIDAYLTLQYVPDPMSAFEAVRKLPPAHWMEVTEAGVRMERYWALDYTDRLAGVDEAELAERLKAHLDEAVRLRLISEVPLGAFLSGGVDSSAVVASMAEAMSEPVRTFSIAFSDRAFDESEYARKVAQLFGTRHEELRVEPDALAIMPTLARHYGEPFADASAIPSFLLARMTGQHVTVALNGDGGDEAFAGYGRYAGHNIVGRLDWLPRPLQRMAPAVGSALGEGSHERSFRSRAGRLGRALGAEPWERYTFGLSAWDAIRRRRLLSPEFAARVRGDGPERLIAGLWLDGPERGPIDTMLDVDVNTYLPGDLMVKVDIASMAYSVEARSPFLDHRLMEFAASLPERHKMSGGAGKLLLKRAMRGILPDDVLDRPKMGFGVPLGSWLRNELRDLPAERLLDPRALDRGYFRREEVERTIADHQSGAVDHSHRLWVLLQLEEWHREVVEVPALSASAA